MLNILKSKENIALKGRLSNATTITKQINAIKEGIALTMKSWEVKARGVSKSILKQFEGLYCKRLWTVQLIYSMKPFYVALRYIITKSSNVLCCFDFTGGTEKSWHRVIQAKLKKIGNRVKTTDLELVSGISLLLSSISQALSDL